MSPFRKPQKSTPEQALSLLQHFCGYRERCHEEVREKLRSMGIWRTDQDNIIAKLIEGDYLNEERYARLFASGKFRINRWGRKRIRYALLQKKISEYCIRKGLQEIDEVEYDQTIEKLVDERMRQQVGPIALRRQKTMVYLIGRGFESERIRPFLRD